VVLNRLLRGLSVGLYVRRPTYVSLLSITRKRLKRGSPNCVHGMTLRTSLMRLCVWVKGHRGQGQRLELGGVGSMLLCVFLYLPSSLYFSPYLPPSLFLYLLPLFLSLFLSLSPPSLSPLPPCLPASPPPSLSLFPPFLPLIFPLPVFLPLPLSSLFLPLVFSSPPCLPASVPLSLLLSRFPAYSP